MNKCRFKFLLFHLIIPLLFFQPIKAQIPIGGGAGIPPPPPRPPLPQGGPSIAPGSPSNLLFTGTGSNLYYGGPREILQYWKLTDKIYISFSQFGAIWT
jgi:hypothetical protein